MLTGNLQFHTIYVRMLVYINDVYGKFCSSNDNKNL